MPRALPAAPTTLAARPVPPTGRRTQTRAIMVVVLVVLLLAAIALSLAVGAKTIGAHTVWTALTDYDPTQPDQITIRTARLPRTLVGLGAGIALGTSGALMQALTRNPLADPGILGVNAGAGFAVVAAVAALGVTSIEGFVWFAFAGAVAATVAVYAIGSRGRGGATPVRLTLAGVALSAVLNGVASGVSLLRPDVFDSLRFWGSGATAGAGSLAGRTMEMARATAPFIAVGLVLALVLTRQLNTVALGDELARSLGSHVGRTRALAAVAITLMCGAATAAAGPIAFVGLMVPHIGRSIAGPDQRWILPIAAVGGGALVLLSDVLGRVIAAPAEVPVGIVTAFVGAPVLIALVRRRKVSDL